MTADWLQDLEEKVTQATTELGRLREENEKLSSQNEELSSRLAELEQQASAAGETEDQDGWQAERAEIKQRVERLSANLQSLLDG